MKLTTIINNTQIMGERKMAISLTARGYGVLIIPGRAAAYTSLSLGEGGVSFTHCLYLRVNGSLLLTQCITSSAPGTLSLHSSTYHGSLPRKHLTLTIFKA